MSLQLIEGQPGFFRDTDTGQVTIPQRRGMPTHGEMPPGVIAWSEYLEAFAEYERQYNTGLTAEAFVGGGGFSWVQLLKYLGHLPTTWEAR